MLKKLLVTAAAAAAVSVPLAGVAWADKPSDPGSNGNGPGGVPADVGAALNRNYPVTNPLDANGQVVPVSPGSVFSTAATTKPPGTSLPEAYSAGLAQLFTLQSPVPGVGGLPENVIPGPGSNVPDPTIPATSLPPNTDVVVATKPGAVVKLFTPGCVNGKGPRPSVKINGVSAGVGCF
jgi:hypothetical protein